MQYKYAFKRKSATVVCFTFISLLSHAQHWSVDDRSYTFMTLAQGGVPPDNQIGYMNKGNANDKRDLFYHIYLHYSIFRYYLTIDDIASRYYAFIYSFITKKCTHQFNTVNLDMYAMPLVELKKSWCKPAYLKDSLLNDKRPIDRLNLLLAILPFQIDGFKKPDSIVIILKNIPYVSPVLKDKGLYAQLLASVIHFYVLQGERKVVYIIFNDENKNKDCYVFLKTRRFSKKMAYISDPSIIDYVK